MPPFVNLVVPGALDLLADPFHNDVGLYLRAFCEGLVGVVFLGNCLGAAEGSVAGYEHAAVAVVDTVAERFSGETAEYDTSGSAPMREAGENADRQLGNHRQIEGDAVAFLNAVFLENVGEFADFFMELFVGEFFVFTRVVSFPDEGYLVPSFLQVPVKTVVGHVQLAALEPFDFEIFQVLGIVAVC